MNLVVAGSLFATMLASPAAAAHELIWSDEFGGSQLDLAKWNAAHDCWGGGNEERQCYTPGNVRVADGLLRIAARHERETGPAGPQGQRPTVARDYSSGRVDTRTHASFLFGRVEVRAKVPNGQGLWPAIWLLPEHDNYGPFPASGEIDVAEFVNLGVRCIGCRDLVHGAVHHGPTNGKSRQMSASAHLSEPHGFHVYALSWTKTDMVWSVDGRPFHRVQTHPPFDQRFHLILNLAVGGRWPEGSGKGGVDPSGLPAEMQVDWVRVYAN